MKRNIENFDNPSTSKFKTKKELKVNDKTADFEKLYSQLQQQVGYTGKIEDESSTYILLMKKIYEVTKLLEDDPTEMRASKFYSAK